MTKMTSFMRVTKLPKTRGKKVGASHPGVKQQVRRDALVDQKETTGLSDEEAKAHVPTFIYKAVKYQSSHEEHEVSAEMKTVLAYIKKFYDVPNNFERDAKFGCHSGLTYEKRVARAYAMGQLTRKPVKAGEDAAPQPICLTCAKVGHTYKSCPEGF
uniref:CCHC-type domain-containing protein n=1 Tax=Peronospora matthiolae TaxID=2874970 RepID=A0AAV1URM4_9STRA